MTSVVEALSAAPRADALASHRAWRHRFACAHVVAVWLLVIAGASVTSHDAGLAVTDWPTSFGSWNPILVYLRGLVTGGAIYEHGHRVLAQAIGLLTIVETLWLWRTAERRLLRVLGALLLAGVCVQGVLGGITVLAKLPPAVSVLHGVVAQSFLCLSIATACVVSPQWRIAPPRGGATARHPIQSAALVAFAALWLQLVLGAIVRHTVAKGRVPVFADPPVLLHAAFAAAVVVAIGRLVTRVMVESAADARLARPALAMGALALLQISLGLLSITTRSDPLVTIGHVVTGATLLGLAMLVVMRSSRLAAAAPLLERSAR